MGSLAAYWRSVYKAAALRSLFCGFFVSYDHDFRLLLYRWLEHERAELL